MNGKKRKLIIIFGIVLILLLVIIPFGISVMIYEDNFGSRYETYAPMARSIDEFEGLKLEKYTFPSNQGQKLAGYKYYKDFDTYKGVVVIAHGLGGGGHNSYMDMADLFASNGYIVFAYDATGNDESEGNSVRGLPQGIADLDYAIQFVKQTSDFAGLPIMLFGHSWGGYSAGSVLSLHPDVKAVVIVAGFNKSMDIIEEEGKRIAGEGVQIFMPYISSYERIKLGKYASYNCMAGFENSDAGVMIIHSTDDEMISPEVSFDVFEENYKNDTRFRFKRFENRGHSYIYYSDKAHEYIDTFNATFDQYVSSLDTELTAEIKEAYLKENLDKKSMYQLDHELMNQIIEFYDNYTKQACCSNNF